MPEVGQVFGATNDHSYPGAWTIVPGKPGGSLFTGPVLVAPQTTWESDWQPFNIAHTAPEGATWLDFMAEGVKCLLNYGLLTDNAGRRWEMRTQRGKRARRLRWYSPTGSH